MSEQIKNSTTKMAVVVMVASVVARCFGFLREILTGSILGTTYVADAYNMALSIPNILFMNIAAAIGTTFIPIYVSVREKSGNQESQRFANNILNIVLLIGTLLAILSVIFAKPILSLFAYGFDDITMQVAVDISRIIFFLVFFLGVNTVLSSYLNSNNKFFMTSIIGMPYCVILIAALLLYNRLGIQGIAYASLIGTLSQTIVLAINAFVSGFRPKIVVDFKDSMLRSMLLLAIPTFIGSSTSQISAIVDRMLASSLSEGSVSALNYANKLDQFIYAVTAVAISTVIYPSLSKFYASGDKEAFKNMVTRGINVVTIMLLPITVGACILNQHIVKMLFERGAFGAHSTSLTASALMYYSLGLIFLGYRAILGRAFFSMNDTKTPTINGVITLVIDIILNVVLVQFMAHNGLALATSVAPAITTLPLLYSLRKKIGNVGGKKIVSVFVKSILAAVLMGVAVYFTSIALKSMLISSSLLNDVFVFGILVVEGVLIYFGLMISLKVSEISWFLKMFLKRKPS